MNPRRFSCKSRSPKKVGNKPERGDRACKRAAKAQRDLFRKRKSKETLAYYSVSDKK